MSYIGGPLPDLNNYPNTFAPQPPGTSLGNGNLFQQGNSFFENFPGRNTIFNRKWWAPPQQSGESANPSVNEGLLKESGQSKALGDFIRSGGTLTDAQGNPTEIGTETVPGTGDESGDGSGKGGFNDPEFWKQIRGMQDDALGQSKEMMYGKLALGSLTNLAKAHTTRGLADAEGHSNLQRTLAATYAAGKRPQFLTDMRYAGPNINYRFLG
jgi:hypothetical protein